MSAQTPSTEAPRGSRRKPTTYLGLFSVFEYRFADFSHGLWTSTSPGLWSGWFPATLREACSPVARGQNRRAHPAKFTPRPHVSKTQATWPMLSTGNDLPPSDVCRSFASVQIAADRDQGGLLRFRSRLSRSYHALRSAIVLLNSSPSMSNSG